MSHQPARCQQCGQDIEILTHPLRRLRWTRYWWHGLASLVTHPLKFCQRCGAIYTYSGRLVAAGAAETVTELKVRRFRADMASLRDGFGTVAVASAITLLWTQIGPESYDAIVSVIASVVGGVSLVPFTYFAGKVRRTSRELKRLKAARQKGEVLE